MEYTITILVIALLLVVGYFIYTGNISIISPKNTITIVPTYNPGWHWPMWYSPELKILGSAPKLTEFDVYSPELKIRSSASKYKVRRLPITHEVNVNHIGVPGGPARGPIRIPL